MCIHNPLSVKHFHGVSAGNVHECSPNLNIGIVRSVWIFILLIVWQPEQAVRFIQRLQPCKRLSLNLSEFVGGRNGQSTSQILPSWLCWQWLDLTLPARSALPARMHFVDACSAGIERTRHTLADCICRCHETPEGMA